MNPDTRQDWLKVILPAAIIIAGYIWFGPLYDDELDRMRARVAEFRRESSAPYDHRQHIAELRELRGQMRELEAQRDGLTARMDRLVARFEDDAPRARSAQRLAALLQAHELLVVEQSVAPGLNQIALPESMRPLARKIAERRGANGLGFAEHPQHRWRRESGSADTAPQPRLSAAQRRATGMDSAQLRQLEQRTGSRTGAQRTWADNADAGEFHLREIHLLGRYLDVLAAMEAIAQEPDLGVVIGLEMQHGPTGTPYRRWRILVWI